MKIGRNDPCHCGSEKKFKHCHQKKNLKNNNQNILIGVFVIAIIVFFIIDSSTNSQSNIIPSNTLTNTNNLISKTKPSTPAPPGKVWSEAHGHWHDAPISNNSSSLRLNNNNISKTKPSTPAPPGKVWSEAHGHWHDAPKNQNLSPGLINVPNRKINTEKNNLTPEGKVWDDNHGHYHNEK